MKILISDFLFVNAHKTMNIDLINSISKFASVDLISLNGYYDVDKERLTSNGINIIDFSLEKGKTGPIKSRLYSKKIMKLTGRQATLADYNLVVALAYDTIAFAAGLKYFKGIKIAVFHHKNIDELTNKLKKIIFGFYKNKIYHFVFEQFFREYLVENMAVDKKKVFLVFHPVKNIEPGSDTEIKYDCVGLCNSNSEKFIDDVILLNDELARCGKKVLLRSKNRRRSLSNVEIISGYMEYEEYNSIIQSGAAVLVPLPDDYIYRLSGSIYDAISRKKKVYTSSSFYAEDYGRRYPGICKRVASADELLTQLCLETEKNEESFSLFIEEHSLERVSQSLKSCISVII